MGRALPEAPQRRFQQAASRHVPLIVARRGFSPKLWCRALVAALGADRSINGAWNWSRAPGQI